MPSAVELGGGKILLVTEGVRDTPPHAGMTRWVASRDGGKTWGWQNPGRGVVYEIPHPLFSTYSACLTALPVGALVCAMSVNEDRDKTDAPATPAPLLNGDIKYSLSADGGKTWSKPAPVVLGGHRDYAPKILSLGASRVVCLYLDFARNAYRSVPGTLTR